MGLDYFKEMSQSRLQEGLGYGRSKLWEVWVTGGLGYMSGLWVSRLRESRLWEFRSQYHLIIPTGRSNTKLHIKVISMNLWNLSEHNLKELWPISLFQTHLSQQTSVLTLFYRLGVTVIPYKELSDRIQTRIQN